MKLRRRTNGTSVRHEMKRHPGVVVVLTVPTNSEAVAWLEGGNNYVQAVVHGVLAIEGHPEAAEFGAPGSPERVDFVESMDPRDLFEIGSAIDALTMISEDEAKN